MSERSTLTAEEIGELEMIERTTDLRPIQDRPRILIISSLDVPQDVEAQLVRMRSAKEGFYDRDMLVIAVRTGKEAKVEIIKDLSAPAFRKDDVSFYQNYYKYIASRELYIMLVGKDRGVKQSWDELIEPQEVFKLIDQMPMRALETQ